MFPKETKILIADDLKATRLALRKSLSDLGLKQVIEAEDGEDAWEQVVKSINHHTPFQLVICDMQMPHMSGFELLDKIRRVAELQRTVFILVTSGGAAGVAAQAKARGAAAVLTKPLKASALSETLFQVWQDTRAMREKK
jgi:two-component system chemotaxis response regulator CheY